MVCGVRCVTRDENEVAHALYFPDKMYSRRLGGNVLECMIHRDRRYNYCQHCQHR